MVSEELLSIHDRLQIHCIVHIDICIKGPDDKTIVFCRSLQVMLNFCRRKEEKNCEEMNCTK